KKKRCICQAAGRHKMPDIADQAKSLINRLKEETDRLDGKVRFWWPRAAWGQIGTAIVGALITVIAGWKGEIQWPWGFQTTFLQKENAILVLGAIITGISAWQAFYSHRDRWIGYSSCANKLRVLSERLRCHMQSETFLHDENTLKKYYDEFAEIL